MPLTMVGLSQVNALERVPGELKAGPSLLSIHGVVHFLVGHFYFVKVGHVT